jgi:Mg2+ and Co2+ transporter CorA
MNVHVPGQDDERLAWFLGIVGTFVMFLILGAFIARRFGMM